MSRVEQKPLPWRHALICGLLWGLVVVASVMLSQPIGDLDAADLFRWIPSLCLEWGSAGLVLTSGCKLAEDLNRPAALTPVVLVVVALLAVTVTNAFGANRAPGNFGHLSGHIPMLDLAAYTLWVVVFYGGLYGLGYFSTRRALKLRLRLADLRVTRSEAEAKLREARLQVVRGQMQPAMLLDALEALRRAYGRDRRQGDKMFDLLIAFLRSAMPGLRSGASTLLAELAVIDRYDALRTALDGGPPLWRLTLEAPPADLAFPPLRLLPALDRLSRSAPRDSFVEVAAKAAGQAFIVQVGARAAPPVPSALMLQLRAGMRQDLSVGTMMSTDLQEPLVAELRIPLPEPL